MRMDRKVPLVRSMQSRQACVSGQAASWIKTIQILSLSLTLSLPLSLSLVLSNITFMKMKLLPTSWAHGWYKHKM